MPFDERLFDLTQRAAKRISIAAELLLQLSAVQSFEDQAMLERDETSADVIRIVTNFRTEVNEVTRLMDEFLAIRESQEDGEVVDWMFGRMQITAEDPEHENERKPQS